jgi:hypothetical protein
MSISSCTGLFTFAFGEPLAFGKAFGEPLAFGKAFGEPLVAFGEPLGEDILSIPLDKWSEKRHIQR